VSRPLALIVSRAASRGGVGRAGGRGGGRGFNVGRELAHPLGGLRERDRQTSSQALLSAIIAPIVPRPSWSAKHSHD
jgi:hypothetical protein